VARIVNQAAHARRREEFIDVAQRLIQTKGYEQMSIGDVLAELNSSRGAFYHYFDSRQALLEAVVDRTAQTIAATLSAAVDLPGLTAPDKLRRYFGAPAGWKLSRRDLLLAMLRVWQSDDNAIVRQKTRAKIVDYNSPALARIIDHGVRDGAFTAAYPAQCARVILALVQDLNDELAELFLAGELRDNDWQTIEHTIASYTDAVQRVLGAPVDSVVLVQPQMLRSWFRPRRTPQGKEP
jgi:AcrR family transcriptional regulator